MEIHFAKLYDKLINPDLFPEYNKDYGPFTFCTFRGLVFLTKFKPKQVLDVLVNHKHLFFAKVIRLDRIKISDVSIEILKKDTMLNGKSKVNCHQDFVNILNSFRKYNKIQSIHEELCRIILQRIEKVGDLSEWLN